MKQTTLARIVETGLREGVKSIFLFAGCPPLGNRRDIITLGDPVLESGDIEDVLLWSLSPSQYAAFQKEKELDYSYAPDGLGRFRVNAFQRRGSFGIVMRPVPVEVPSFDALDLPVALKEFTKERDGLVLVTGPTGSGKSTTLACLIDTINRTRACHIITIEDPVEFVYRPVKSIISQREVGKDTLSFTAALKSVPREDPDVILIGEIRDQESMQATIEMAETGHLVFATLHTTNAFQTINRILNFFPEGEKGHIRSQLALVLKGIISQRLLTRAGGTGFVCACEIMKAGQSVRSLIRSNKIHQINSVVDILKKEGMVSMDDALVDLYKNGLIEMAAAISCSTDESAFVAKLGAVPYSRAKVMEGKRPSPVNPDTILFKADHREEQLGSFDASGEVSADPGGLAFRDSGQQARESHFIADYSILNGRQNGFRLGSFFHISYAISGSREKKATYSFWVRVVTGKKEETEVPVPTGLIGDGAWHTLDVPIPGAMRGKQVRYYMLVFDGAVTDIVFDDIMFTWGDRWT